MMEGTITPLDDILQMQPGCKSVWAVV
jgi:hypothetical protein